MLQTERSIYFGNIPQDFQPFAKKKKVQCKIGPKLTWIGRLLKNLLWPDLANQSSKRWSKVLKFAGMPLIRGRGAKAS